MRNAFKLVLATLAALLLTGTLLSATTSPAAAAEPQLKVVQSNGDGLGAVEATNRADAVGAKIVTLQEVCRTDVQNLTDGTWKSEGSFIVTRPASCADGSDEGQAILLKKNSGHSGSNLSQTRLYEPANTYRPFYLTCMNVSVTSFSKTLHVCTTHLFTNGEDLGVDGSVVRTNQMNDIEAKMLPWTGNGTHSVIFTGDLNMGETAGALNDVQAAMKDVCEGRITTDSGSKLDYIFADKSPALAGQACAAADHTLAGHKIMNGNITFQ